MSDLGKSKIIIKKLLKFFLVSFALISGTLLISYVCLILYITVSPQAINGRKNIKVWNKIDSGMTREQIMDILDTEPISREKSKYDIADSVYEFEFPPFSSYISGIIVLRYDSVKNDGTMRVIRKIPKEALENF